MKLLINLLPWRQRRRKQRLRLWSVGLVLSMFATVLACTGWASIYASRAELSRIQAKGLMNSQTSLQEVYRQRRQLLQQDERQRQRYLAQVARQRSIARWHSALTELAGRLSTASWLNSVALLKDKVVIQGVAEDVRELTRFEKTLRKMNEVAEVRVGSLKQEPGKGMGFTFTLRLSEVNDAVLP